MERIERQKATEKYILGLLFEVEAPLVEKEETAAQISGDIFGQIVWDKENFQKIALGHLSRFEVEPKQLVAMSRKIAMFV